jgi:hypothetical protein
MATSWLGDPPVEPQLPAETATDPDEERIWIELAAAIRRVQIRRGSVKPERIARAAAEASARALRRPSKGSS